MALAVGRDGPWTGGNPTVRPFFFYGALAPEAGVERALAASGNEGSATGDGADALLLGAAATVPSGFNFGAGIESTPLLQLASAMTTSRAMMVGLDRMCCSFA